MSNVVQTVRAIVVYQNQILLLQKNKESKLPYFYEFPGGKVDAQNPTETELLQALKSELVEETGICISMDDALKLSVNKAYNFSFKEKQYQRQVHYYLIALSKLPNIIINTTVRKDGKNEDKHMSYAFVPIKDYKDMIKEKSISPNSIIAIEQYI